jgi:regulator of RNase E activity RraA
MTVSPETLSALRSVTTATVSMQLLKRGIRRCWIAGAKSIHPPGRRLVGVAFTFRFVPLREDLSTPESYAKEGSIRDAIEAMPAGTVAVIDARGEQGAATLGDILAARMQQRGVLGAVSDGPVRDLAAIKALDFPLFCTGAAAPPSIAGLCFAGWEEPIGCGGVTVLPGAVIVGDEDGVVVVPRALADEVAQGAPEQERFEHFVQLRIARGAPVKGLYPPSQETRAAYEAWCAAGEPED